MKDSKFDKFDVERELRSSRPRPRVDFARELGNEVRSRRETQRSPLGRVGLALALSSLIVVALASFGGIGYASSAASHAAKKPTVAKARVAPKSAAHAQYAPFTPPKAEVVAKVPKDEAAAVAVKTAAPKATSAQLPFTGLALWVPLAVGLLLISLGLVLRTRGRRRHTAAH